MLNKCYNYKLVTWKCGSNTTAEKWLIVALGSRNKKQGKWDWDLTSPLCLIATLSKRIMMQASMWFLGFLHLSKIGEINLNSVLFSPMYLKNHLKHVININKLDILHSFVLYQVLKSSVCFYIYSTFQFRLATFLVFHSHVWLVAISLDSAACGNIWCLERTHIINGC